MGVTAWLGRLTGDFARAYGEAKSGTLDVLRQQWSGWEREAGLRELQRGEERPDVERYATSDDVYAAVNRIADAATGVPWEVQVAGEEQPDTDLGLLLDHPNAWYGRAGFWGRVYSWLLLTGECFILVDRSNPVDRSMPNALWPVSGARITIMPGTKGRVVDGYKYNLPFAAPDEAVWLPPEDVVPLTLWSPANALRGQSPLTSLRLGLDAEQAAKSANRDLFRNGMMSDGLLTLPSANEVQRKQAVDALRARHVREGGRHQIVVIASEARLERLQMTPRDAEFLELDKLTTRDVAKAYGIPPMFLGDMSDATYSNYQTAHRAFWEQAVLPKVRTVAGALTQHLAPQFGLDAEVFGDTSGIEALREDEVAKSETASRLVLAGYDRLWVARRLWGDETPEEAVSPLRPSTLVDPSATSAITGPPVARSVTVAKAPAGAAVRGRLIAAQARLEPILFEHFDAAFATQWAAVSAVLSGLSAFRSAKAPGADLVSLLVAAIMRGVDDMEAAVVASAEAGARGGTAAYQRVFGLDIQPGRVDAATVAFARRTAAQRVAWVQQTTRDSLQSAVTTGLANGEGLEAVRRRVQAVFRTSDEPGMEHVYADRVENIVQTELARSYNHGGVLAMRAGGFEWHEWSYSGLPLTRHLAQDGQRRRIGALFNVNGHPARYPGDGMLPAGQACRCKCCVLPVEHGDLTDADLAEEPQWGEEL